MCGPCVTVEAGEEVVMVVVVVVVVFTPWQPAHNQGSQFQHPSPCNLPSSRSSATGCRRDLPVPLHHPEHVAAPSKFRYDAVAHAILRVLISFPSTPSVHPCQVLPAPPIRAASS
jgi:hypothetical protein